MLAKQIFSIRPIKGRASSFLQPVTPHLFWGVAKDIIVKMLQNESAWIRL